MPAPANCSWCATSPIWCRCISPTAARMASRPRWNTRSTSCGVKHIVVLGHAQCGGIRAFIDKIEPLSPGDFIGKWMAMFVKPGEVVEQREHETMQDFTVRIEKAAVFRSLENLMTFPFVQPPVERGALQLHGAYFGVAEGSLFVLDKAAKEFRSVRESERMANSEVANAPLMSP